MVVTGVSATEGSSLYAAVIAVKPMCGISSTLCQKGSILSGTDTEFAMPEHMTVPQLIAGQCVPGILRLMVRVLILVANWLEGLRRLDFMSSLPTQNMGFRNSPPVSLLGLGLQPRFIHHEGYDG